MRIAVFAALLALCFCVPGAWAQSYIRIPTCGTATPPAGVSQGYMDANGNICGSSAGVVVKTPLDITSVTTGGTAVNALAAGHATKGGFLVTANAAGMCVDQIDTAGTATSGNTVCVAQNQKYTLVPSTGPVSVNSTASAVTLAGEGLN